MVLPSARYKAAHLADINTQALDARGGINSPCWVHPGPTTHMALASLVTHGLAAIADGSAARLLPAGARGADLGTLQPAFEVASFEICTGGNERTDLHFGCAPRGRIRQPRVRRMPPRRHTLTCVHAVLRMQATSREWRVPAPSKPSRPAASRRGATPVSKPSWTALGSRAGSPTPWRRRMVEVPALSLYNNDSPCGQPLPRRPLTCAQGRCLGPRGVLLQLQGLDQGEAVGALCRPKHHRCHRLWPPRRRSDRASPSLSRAASVRARSSLSTSAGKSIHTYVSTQASKVANSEYFARRSIWSIFCLFTYFMICAATMLKWGARTCG